MRIVKYFEYENKESILAQLEQGAHHWRAIPFLLAILKDNAFNMLFGNGGLYLLLEGEELVAFSTFCDKDETAFPEIGPWIGFVFTFPKWRRRHLAGKLIDYYCDELAPKLYPQFNKVFLSSDEKGLYEKYGFKYVGQMKGTWGDEECGVYVRELKTGRAEKGQTDDSAERTLVKIITEQTEILFKNLEDQVAGAELSSVLEDVNNSRYLFHMIHSADKYFVNPYAYRYEKMVAGDIDENYSIISSSREGYIGDDGFVIKREILASYLQYVKLKVMLYLNVLTDKELSDKPKDCPHTKLALILGQYRHSMIHCGMSETFTFEKSGQWLPYTGFKYLKPNS
ncbi:GNAT family N-acetyltransferase [Treponema sp.]|uniref:GNAT family N-acetyltransferase n=1 Tax=Treponema sp. TaxID=166 RepID=UPI00298DE8F2|nr:GNAT family N-acetyltransferase [Treponema sp.]MCR5613969.1 GNAT family N-acetyltransferase [Treponema sp.]